ILPPLESIRVHSRSLAVLFRRWDSSTLVDAELTETKPLINANGREWKRIKKGCFTVVHRERESPPSPLLIGVHSRSLAVLFRRKGGDDFFEARIAAERVPKGVQF